MRMLALSGRRTSPAQLLCGGPLLVSATNGSAKVQLKSEAAGFEEIANFLSNLRSNDS